MDVKEKKEPKEPKEKQTMLTAAPALAPKEQLKLADDATAPVESALVTVLDWAALGYEVEQSIKARNYTHARYIKNPQFLQGLVARTIIANLVPKLNKIVTG